MSFIFGGGGGHPGNTIPDFVGLQVQTSVNTLPNPIFWGVFKGAPNVIWYGDFTKHVVKQGGKGGGKGVKTNDYTASLQMAFSEGVIDSIAAVYVNSNVCKSLSDMQMSLFRGTYPEQSTWSHLTEDHPEDAFSYPGTSIVVVENYDLGSSATTPSHNFLGVRINGFDAPWCRPNNISTGAPALIQSLFGGTGIPTADMALVINDFLTSEQYGVPGFASSFDLTTLMSSSAASTTGDAALQTYLRALGIGMCPSLSSQETASAILNRWLKLCNCAAVWSGDKLKFIPWGDTAITANGVTYLPNIAAVVDLSDADFLNDGSSDPMELSRTDPQDVKNVIRIEVTSDDGNFSNIPIEAWDQSAIENSLTKRFDTSSTAHEIVGTQVGAIIAQLLLQQDLYNRNTVSIKLPVTYCYLEPMDYLTATELFIGYNGQKFFVRSIEEDDQGDLTCIMQEYVPGIADAVVYDKQANQGAFVGSDDGNDVNPPIIFEPPTDLCKKPQVWIALCGAGGGFDPNWGSADVWLSTDDDNYKMIGTISQAARMGYLTADLPAYGGANPDNINTLSVDLSESDGYLLSGAPADATAGRTLCYVDGELLSYTIALLSTVSVTDELHTIPLTAPYVINVAFSDEWVSDAGVKFSPSNVPLTVAPEIYASGTDDLLIEDDGGQLLIHFNTGEYANQGGTYYFSAADAGKNVKLSYGYGNSWHYAATGLDRGQHGTTPGLHLTGTKFARLDDLIFKYDLPDDYVGQILYLKFVSKNIFGLGEQDISTLTPYVYTPIGIEAATGLGAPVVVLNSNVIGSAFNRMALSVSVTPPKDPGLVARFQYQAPTTTPPSAPWDDVSPTPLLYGQYSRILPDPGLYTVRARFETPDAMHAGPWVSIATAVPDPINVLTIEGINAILIDAGLSPILVS